MAGNLFHILYGARSDASQAYRFSGQAARSTAEVKILVGKMASALRRSGVSPGDRVSFKLDKSEEVLLLAHACLQIGAVLHPLNTTYTDVETVDLINDAASRLLVCGEEHVERFQAKVNGIKVTSLGRSSSGALGQLAQSSHPDPNVCSVENNAVAAILYTSGTTGRPKGACISHENLSRSAKALVASWQIQDADRLLHVLPMYHAHGLLTSVNSMFAGGGSILFVDRFDPAEAVTLLPETSVLMATPTHYGRLLRQKGLRDATKHLRLAICGSAPLTSELADRFQEQTGRRIIERYGSTEMAVVTAVPAGREDRTGFVGWPLPGVEIRVADIDGRTAERDAVGELETRGHNVFVGYWRAKDATEKAFTPDGWFKSGDIVEVDETGCVRLLGRSKDIIITGGLNVYPKEVEAALDALLPGSESAVFGVPHPDFGEAVVAVVEGEAVDEKAIVAALRETLAPYKIPKKIMASRSIPKNQIGKVLKNSLRDKHRELFVTLSQQERKTNGFET